MTFHKMSGFALLLLMSTLAFSRPVDPSQSATVAKNFFFERFSAVHATGYDNLRITGTFSREENGQTIYRVYNINDFGFIIVSGEDVTRPVIGYSFEGTYREGNHPPQFTAYLDHVKDQILYHRAHGSAASPDIREAWDRLSATDPGLLVQGKGAKGVNPMLTTTWNQGAYYNELCPQDPAGPGGRVYAGCVATAMAQVMFYYRFPTNGVGSHAYWSDYGQLSANFGNTTYHWDEMLLALNGSNMAVATLLYHCGVAVDMMYSPGGSGAYSEDAADAMKNYFRYASSTRMVYRDNYTATNWANLLKDQLDNKKPMYYHGFGSGGHAFNVDGYQDDDYFHFNWGWSGSYNGYYYLDNLNPGGSNFTNGQGAMIDVVPGGTYPTYCTGTRTITALTGTLEDGSGPFAYQDNSDCQVLLAPQVSPDDSVSRIRITLNRLDTEINEDLVSIYDGPSVSSPLLAVISGSTLPSTILSTSNQVLIHFTSNSSVNAEGWLLTYQAELPDYCSALTSFSNPSGTVSDGSGNKNYNNKSVCQYLIYPPNAQKITLTFNSFQTEPIKDYVEVYSYDTVNSTGVLLGRYSGNQLPPPQVSNTGAMFLIFFTNSSVTSGGWSASYVALPVGMEEDLTSVDLTVYPNPADHILYVGLHTLQQEKVTLSLLDLTGRTVLHQDFGTVGGSFTGQADIAALPAGIYLVRISRASGIRTQRLVIE